MSEMPREIITYGPPGGVFLKSDYPWLQAIRICARGGDAGADADGTPGERGETKFRALSIVEIPETMAVHVGRGGRGAPGAKDGEDAFVIIEMYDHDITD